MKRRAFLSGLLAFVPALAVAAGYKHKAVPRGTVVTETALPDGTVITERRNVTLTEIQQMREHAQRYHIPPDVNGDYWYEVRRRRDERWNDFWDSHLDPLNEALRQQGRLP